MGTNTNNETYEANQREANNSTISGFDMRDKVLIWVANHTEFSEYIQNIQIIRCQWKW